MKNYNELRAGFETAYIDGSVASSLAYRPQFVSNNYKEGKKVLSSIEDELLKCNQFQISVAFITMSGITPLLQTLKELEKKNIPGEILTTNYLNFSEPRALAKLNELTNITLKMYDVEAANEGFHTKGYIFRKDEIYRIIIGSSNITSAALTSNREWNTKLISTDQGEMAKEIVRDNALDRVYMALDYFDASINRVSALATGFRSWQKALLIALCTPNAMFKALQDTNQMSKLMVMNEAVKMLPIGEIWDEYLRREGVVDDLHFYDEIEKYENEVLEKRN